MEQVLRFDKKIILKTLIGREIIGFEKVSSIKEGSYLKLTSFLLKEAIKEAKIKNDKLHGIPYVNIFENINTKKIGNYELDLINIYLFGKAEYFQFVEKDIYSELVELL